jgi:hypothetical protein
LFNPGIIIEIPDFIFHLLQINFPSASFTLAIAYASIFQGVLLSVAFGILTHPSIKNTIQESV